MRHYKYEKINWKEVQKEYDFNKNLSLNDICIKYNISRTCLETAIKKNLFKKDNKRFHKHTEEIKKLLSEKQKLYLKNNPNKHPWKITTKFKSKPCEYLKEELRKNNISFVEEFGNFKDHNYSIDIAFPNDKIGIEVNGNQHYNNDGTLKEYYKERQKYIESFGWKLYQIHYSLVYDKTVLNLIIQQIKNNIKNLNVDYSFYIPNKENIIQKRTCKICKRVLKYDLNKDNICKKCLQQINKNKLYEERKQLILNSNIDFSKFGWVEKLEKYLKNTKFSFTGRYWVRWIKKYMFDFYNKNCFKRKVN